MVGRTPNTGRRETTLRPFRRLITGGNFGVHDSAGGVWLMDTPKRRSAYWPVTIAIISGLLGWVGYTAVNDSANGGSTDTDVKLGSGR